jgi:two-component system phosphate regulon response regulator OmpR
MESQSKPGEPPATMGHEVRMGRCVLNLDSGKLYDLTGGEVALTAMEFDLLKAFAERPNRILSRDMLLDLAHNREMEAFDRSIDIRIMRLRRKIEEDPEKPQSLKTVRGQGYIFTAGQPRSQVR